MFEQEELPEAHLFRWFLIPGCIGLAVAAAITVLMFCCSLPPPVALSLWPASILGLVDPTTAWSKAITGIFTLGGNFVLYGLIGVGVGYGIYKFRCLIGPR